MPHSSRKWMKSRDNTYTRFCNICEIPIRGEVGFRLHARMKHPGVRLTEGDIKEDIWCSVCGLALRPHSRICTRCNRV